MSQYELIKNKQKEFHIKIFNNNDKTQFYFNNTGNDLWREIQKYVKKKWNITNMGLDSDWKNANYLWIHVPDDPNIPSENRIINHIITDLNDNYSKELQSHFVPKLMCTINKKFSSDEQYFAKAICEYQDKHGKEQTELALYVYFNDIKKTQIYLKRYYTDSDGD